MKKQYFPLIRLAAAATVLQLLVIVFYAIVAAYTGPRPFTAFEAFQAFEQGDLFGLLKDEILLTFLIFLYLINFSALFFLLRENHFTLAFLAALFTFSAVILTLANHSGFSLMYLSRIYEETADEAVRARILTAGEAVLAKNIWNGTSSYYSGFLLQGGGVLMSLAMMGSGRFSKITIFSGLASNALDLIQHAIHLFVPGPAETILKIAGPFYIIWYVALSCDLWRSSRDPAKTKRVENVG